MQDVGGFFSVGQNGDVGTGIDTTAELPVAVPLLVHTCSWVELEESLKRYGKGACPAPPEVSFPKNSAAVQTP